MPRGSIRQRRIRSWTLLFICLMLLAAFFYLDRQSHVSQIIRSFGSGGIIGAIIVMAVACLTPFPTEGVLLMYLKIYGFGWGMLYAWSGFILGSLLAFWVARGFGNKIVRNWISDERFQAVDRWVTQRGTFGLLIVRVLPIPAFLVNYSAGIMPSVSLWNYAWTSVAGIIPYYALISLIFLGVSRRDLITVSLAVLVFIVVWFVGSWIYRRGRHWS